MGPRILILFFLQEISFRPYSNHLKYWSDPSGLTRENRQKPPILALFCINYVIKFGDSPRLARKYNIMKVQTILNKKVEKPVQASTCQGIFNFDRKFSFCHFSK